MLPFLVAISTVAVLLSSTFTSAQTQCGIGPFNLTALTTTDLLLDNTAQGGAAYAIRPCGAVTTAGYCAGGSTPFSFCRGTTGISYYNTSAVGNTNSDYAAYNTDNSAYWGYVTRDGQSGVAQFIQDGSDCGNGDWAGTIEFICDPTATTARLSDVFETTGCNLDAVIYTSLVCGVTPAQVQAANVPYISTTQCGGGIYDLSSLANTDLQLSYSTTTGFVFRPCGTISSISACSGVMACQYALAHPTYNNMSTDIANWQPFATAVFYQNLGQGVGVSQLLQDGASCNGEQRFVNISYLCNSTATTAAVTSFTEGPTCHYSITVQTSVVCTQTPYTVAAPATTSTTCGTSLYNLNSITNHTLTVQVSGTHWAVRPCGFITDLGLCAGQVCQGTTVVNQYAVNEAQTSASYEALTDSYSVPVWAAASLNGQTGVVQTLQTGAYCGSGTGARQANVFYMCNSTATVPYISSVLPEGPTCHYGLVVQTAAACGVSTAQTQAVGQTVSSEVCGGGIYDLSALTGDITGAFGNAIYTINLCSNITTPAALAGCGLDNQAFNNVNVYYSACQYYASGGGEGLAYYPAQAPKPNNLQVFWTWLGAGVGVQQYIQDGFGDCGGTTEERAVNVTLLCNSTATVPFMSAESEGPECHYNIVVQTNAVCGTPLFAAPGSGSSSSGASATTGSSASAVSAATSVSVVSGASAVSSSSVSAASAVSSSANSAAASAASSSSNSAVSTAAVTPSSSAVSAVSSSAAATSSPAASPSSSSSSAAASASSTAAASVSSSSSSAAAASTASAPSSSSTAAASVTSAASSASPSSTPSVASSSATVPVLSSSSVAPPPSTTTASGANAVQLSGMVVAVVLMAVVALLL